jgi:hypothetical protein
MRLEIEKGNKSVGVFFVYLYLKYILTPYINYILIPCVKLKFFIKGE